MEITHRYKLSDFAKKHSDVLRPLNNWIENRYNTTSMKITQIKTEKEYRDICKQMDTLIDKGSMLGDMDLLPEIDKKEYIRLSTLVRKWEKVHYPHPIPGNPLIAKIQERMAEKNLKQKDTAILLGIDEARMSEILRGKRAISMRLAKSLRKNLNIEADMLLDFA